MAGIFKILLVFATVFVGGILSYNDLGGLTGIRESFLRFHGSAFLVRALKTVFLVYFLW